MTLNLSLAGFTISANSVFVASIILNLAFVLIEFVANSIALFIHAGHNLRLVQLASPACVAISTTENALTKHVVLHTTNEYDKACVIKEKESGLHNLHVTQSTIEFES